VLGALLNPLRVPERALGGLESLAEAAQQLGVMRTELTRVREGIGPLPDLIERVRAQTEPVPGMLPTVERISEQAEPLAELLPALEHLEKSLGTGLENLHTTIVALEGDDSHLNRGVQRLGEDMQSMQSTISGLQDDVQRITDRLPDPSRGPLDKAREVLTSSGE
jgi:predicted nuclease with TOPRIM domain